MCEEKVPNGGELKKKYQQQGEGWGRVPGNCKEQGGREGGKGINEGR